VRLLNIGGGFGIPYFLGERPLDIAAVGANLASLMDGMKRRLPQARVAIELGRYLVGEAGIYVCRVIDRKISRGQVFLVTDGGLHHHLAASGNFGQVIRKNYPVVVGSKVVGGEREVASVVGPLCTPLDLLADNLAMAKADVGDLIVVFQSGAYGLTASPTAFLSHPAPVECWFESKSCQSAITLSSRGKSNHSLENLQCDVICTALFSLSYLPSFVRAGASGQAAAQRRLLTPCS